MIIVYVGIGSNIHPEQNIAMGLNLISRTEKIIMVSNFYRTKPIGNLDAPDFINGVVAIKSGCSPLELKENLRKIESSRGRIRTNDPYAPRTLDLDILLYGNCVIREKNIVIPDPDIRSRNFIAIPLFELNPSAVLPDTGEPISNIVNKFDKSGMDLMDNLSDMLQKKWNKK